MGENENKSPCHAQPPHRQGCLGRNTDKREAVRKEVHMKINQLVVGITIASLSLVGCATYPKIDATLDFADRDPLTAKFTWPNYELIVLPDQGRESLIGTWNATFTSYIRTLPAQSNSSGILSSLNSVDFVFLPDGTYTRRERIQPHFKEWKEDPVYNITYFGKWSYQDGMLTLLQETLQYESEQPTSCIAKEDYIIEWFKGDEVILRDMDEVSQDGNVRITVDVNTVGVRIERRINVQSGEGANARGSVLETATLSRYKKTQ